MSDPKLIHIIPPYLLFTCLGLELQRKLYSIDPELGARNAIIPSSSCYFRQPKHLPSKKHAFCDNEVINEAIKKKLKEWFAESGILGASPPQDLSDDYLFELYEIFKSRLRMEASHKDDSNGNQKVETRLNSLSSTGAASSGSDASINTKHSLFEYPCLGEFKYTTEALIEAEGENFSASSLIKNVPLTQLMKWARDTNEHKYSFFPYLMVDNMQTFLSPLPMYWTPLSIDKHLEQLDALLGMAVNLESGYSVLEFRLNKVDFHFEDMVRKKRYYNFIANKEVNDRTSIFYYEVLVEQKTTPATNYRPILQANDSSLSSGSSLFFSVGFTKRIVRFDKMPNSSGATSSIQSIDLREVQNGIASYNLDAYYKKFDDDTITFLGAEPGITFEGSFAVSFNNSCSYASTKSGDNSYRTSSLNMNRRFSQLNRQSVSEHENSRLDIEVPFTTHTKPEVKGNKQLSTDTIGCGVNFINKTLFITLNGILVKTITDKEIVSTNKYKDSIFEQGSKLNSLYPMIGFQLSEIPKEIGEGDLPESKVITNFGQKEFMFNINRYVKEFKTEKEMELNTTICEEITNLSLLSSVLTDALVASFEKSVRNIKDDPSLLNNFIQGYLIQEGYLQTLDSFEADLIDLEKNTAFESKEFALMLDSEDLRDTADLIEQSDAHNRHKLRMFIFNNEFLNAAEFLQQNYPRLDLIQRCIFELKVLHYIHLLKHFVNVKFGNEFEFENAGEKKEAKLFDEAFEYGKRLLSSPEISPSLRHALGELSSVLLLKSKEDLAELKHAKKFMDNFDREIEDLANDTNLAILELRGFGRESKLERMIRSAGRNISTLCAEHDDPFKMINYERDFIDI